MELTQHFVLHCIFIGILAGVNYFIQVIPDWIFFIRLIGSFLINPDLDHIFRKLGLHRWAWFHSALLPLTFYWVLRPYILVSNRLEFSLLLFFPIIIHLFGDSKPHRLIFAFLGDIKEYYQKRKQLETKTKKGKRKSIEIRITEGNHEYGGTWALSIFPFTKNRLSFYQSLTWMIINIGGMIGCIVYFYYFP